MKGSPKNLSHKNQKLSVSKRVRTLLENMTLEEKIAQLTGAWNEGIEEFGQDFIDDPKKMKECFGNGIHSVHSVFSGIEKTIIVRNQIQKYLTEKTRLGIPAVFVDEGLHGLMNEKATVFPQAIGLACSWDPDLFEKVFSVAAHEMRSRGIHWALTPVIDVCRDPRWGRVEETYGEDPYLNGVLAIAAVKGLQGSSDGTVAIDHVAATLKHFVGHGQPEGGINQGPGNYSLRVLREFHMSPFKAAIEKAKPVSLMPSYNEVDGVMSHVNKWLLRDVLRKEWKFKGMVVSDYYGIEYVYKKDCVAVDDKEAAAKAFTSGVQYEFPKKNCFRHLPALVKEGCIKLKDIDLAVSSILELKCRLGLFENPYADLKNAVAVSKNPDSKQLALRAAHESIVLLKNEKLLPLSKKKYNTIAVVGPCGKDVFFGGYSGEPYQKVSLLEGIKSKVMPKTKVVFAQGCILTTNTDLSYYNWKYNDIVFAQEEKNRKLIRQAVQTAKKADIVILAIGENEHLCREATAKNHIGDNMTLDLLCQQEDLARAILELDKPVVVYLMNGRPLSINYIAQKASAIIEGWYMGQETGTAAADIIFGDVNPSGKLTITFPKSVGQLPMYYNHKPSAQYHDYLSMDVQPLFHFGYGLSYTTFLYDVPRLRKSTVTTRETATVSVTVTNTGKIAGDEIVQLYIRDKVSSVTRPVKELKGFQRISLKPGEIRKVTMEITPEMLAFYNIDMKCVVEPGEFEIMIGSSSRDTDLKKCVLKVSENV